MASSPAAILSAAEFPVVADRLVAVCLRAMRPISLIAFPVTDIDAAARVVAPLGRDADATGALGDGLVGLLCPLTTASGAVTVAHRCLDALSAAGIGGLGAAVVSLPQSVMTAADLLAAVRTIAVIDLRDQPAGTVVCADLPDETARTSPGRD
jgi:hypothetical protein